MQLTHKDIIDKFGLEKYKYLAKGYYDLDYVFKDDNINHPVCRYMIYASLPFCEVNRVYNDEYNKNIDIGSTYEWLEDYPTDEEIAKFMKGE